MVTGETFGALFARMTGELDSAFEAGQLLHHVTGIRSHDLPFRGGDEAGEEAVARLVDLCCRRKAGEPLQYLLGEWEFFGLPFRVGPGVLIPRQDTETLVEAALAAAGNYSGPLRILDLCSGSGAVAVALAHSLPDAQVAAVELSPGAFSYLERNIVENGVPVQAVQGDLYSYIPPRPLHLITANPPYIPSEELEGLQAEVQQEPRSALDGGGDGLDFYRGIARRYREYLEPGGMLLVEVGAGQAGDVKEIFDREGFGETSCTLDLTGIERVVTGRRV